MEAKRSIAISINIDKKLDSLVGSRFTKEELNKTLSELFNCPVVVSEYEREECVKNDIPELDNQFLFEIAGEYEIDVDLYYIKDNGGLYYITETNFEYF